MPFGLLRRFRPLIGQMPVGVGPLCLLETSEHIVTYCTLSLAVAHVSENVAERVLNEHRPGNTYQQNLDNMRRNATLKTT